MEVDSQEQLQRKQSNYLSLDENFEIQKEVYRGQQYSQIYFARLHMMRTLLYSLVPNWKSHLPVCTVLELEEGKECIIVGTLYKHMKLKPCILDEYSKERSVAPLIKPHNFMHQDDYLVLEDESGRVKLGGTKLSPSVYVTGVVVALHGKETSAGAFFVEDVLEAGLPPQIERPLKSMFILDRLILLSNMLRKLQMIYKVIFIHQELTSRALYLCISLKLRFQDMRCYLDLSHEPSAFPFYLSRHSLYLKVQPFCLVNKASKSSNFDSGQEKTSMLFFVSGLSIGSSSSNPLQFQLLVDHITGHLGDEEEQGLAAQIVHLVIVGNSVEISRGLLNGQNLASKDQSRLSEPFKELDILLTQVFSSHHCDDQHFKVSLLKFLYCSCCLSIFTYVQIAASLPLDIMPGSSDPANFALPQQPLNRCLFPGSATYNTFRSCTNPHCFELDSIRFLGTSGQNIDDLTKYSEAKDKLDFLERTLRWRHLAPTAPNTLVKPFIYICTCTAIHTTEQNDMSI
ncbi:hypothetical protein CXB51_003349 [Gossypium anomalum]|uniref:DNA polymerase delta small subunit n=1 Tax=Gossypium anomalum TaxID=47600 RepID=A0A8J5Z5V5_9ROSI|nr:hypothetical protein CXB51_003349 [Gossypium anomalum]